LRGEVPPLRGTGDADAGELVIACEVLAMRGAPDPAVDYLGGDGGFGIIVVGADVLAHAANRQECTGEAEALREAFVSNRDRAARHVVAVLAGDLRQDVVGDERGEPLRPTVAVCLLEDPLLERA